ncbi:MAG TPA: hypothetical protein VIT92_01795 [Burkholderiaceae bacterium]
MAKIVLAVNFDIDQESELLDWSFNEEGQQIVPQTQGLETGMLQLKKGDVLVAQITANSYKDALSAFEVIDCALINRPILNAWTLPQPGTYPPPSPYFDPALEDTGGVSSMLPMQYGAASKAQQSCTGRSLTVTDIGRWETAFVVTVAITRTDGTRSNRVFAFDPETYVGTGAD